jgi:hypothetical protein
MTMTNELGYLNKVFKKPPILVAGVEEWKWKQVVNYLLIRIRANERTFKIL